MTILNCKVVKVYVGVTKTVVNMTLNVRPFIGDKLPISEAIEEVTSVVIVTESLKKDHPELEGHDLLVYVE